MPTINQIRIRFPLSRRLNSEYIAGLRIFHLSAKQKNKMNILGNICLTLSRFEDYSKTFLELFRQYSIAQNKYVSVLVELSLFKLEVSPDINIKESASDALSTFQRTYPQLTPSNKGNTLFEITLQSESEEKLFCLILQYCIST